MIVELIGKRRIIPVIAIENAKAIIPLCKALEAGGLEVAEITFRTASAREAIELAAREFPKFALGAGTVTTLEEVEAAKAAGAQFAVAPGFNPRIVQRAQEIGLPFFPGVCTPSEIELALEAGCRVLKYFPAGEMGGVKMIKALSGPYKHKGLRFIPTGGVNVENLADYVREPTVLAIGGTWITTSKLIESEDWAKIEKLTAEAVEIAKVSSFEFRVSS